MKDQKKKLNLNKETDSDRLGGLVAIDALSLDLVSAFAGDRQLTKSEQKLFDEMKTNRGDKFYGDLLYAISHQFFHPKVAYELWHHILKHKIEMSDAMNRNIKITVASLDYLCNITNNLQFATIISEKHIAEIVRGSLHDGLTGLYNHAYCQQTIDVELKRYARYGTMVSLMMIDIDKFKDINDRYGHQEGDKILSKIGMIIKQGTRECDTCCRYGGEEFVVILPITHLAETVLLAEKLRVKIEKSMPGNRKVTVSIGVTSCGDTSNTPYSFLKGADDALYKAKTEGRNRVISRE
jgi:diguanylate cyclase (GGDEF)-like protein